MCSLGKGSHDKWPSTLLKGKPLAQGSWSFSSLCFPQYLGHNKVTVIHVCEYASDLVLEMPIFT